MDWPLANLHEPLASLFAKMCQQFPRRIVALELFGSQADASAISTSDIDVCLVVDGQDGNPIAADVRDAAKAFAIAHGLSGLDIVVFERQVLLRDGHYRIKSCSHHLFGEDIRSDMPDLSSETYLRTYVQAPIAYMTAVLRGREWIASPVACPDPDAPYFGYDSRRLPPDLQPLPNIKALVSTACWIASILVSFRSGEPVASRAEAVVRYRGRLERVRRRSVWVWPTEARLSFAYGGSGSGLPSPPVCPDASIGESLSRALSPVLAGRTPEWRP